MKDIRTIAICDDDRKTQTLLELSCKEYYSLRNQEICIDAFDTGEELLLSLKKYDFILLDIEMHDLNGIEVAEKIRETDIDTMIVIISGYPKYKNRAYSAHVFDYLDKPVNKQKIFRLFDELERYISKKIKRTFLSFKTIDGVVQLDKDDIKFFEYYDRKINIHTIDNVYYMYGKISDLAKQLTKYDFIFPHRSYVVNMKFVEKIDRNTIVIGKNDLLIPISKLKRKEISDTFFNYLSREADNI